MKLFVIDIPIYGGLLLILLTDKHEEIAAISDEIEVPNDKELYAYTYYDFGFNGKEAVMMVFNFNYLSGIDLNVIVHEIEHAGNYILKERGINFWSGMDEASAYLKGWMATQVQDFLIKNNLHNELFKKK